MSLTEEDRQLMKMGKRIKDDYDKLQEINKLCEICPIKDQQTVKALIRRLDRAAKLEAFLSGLARTSLLDWGKVSDKL